MSKPATEATRVMNSSFLNQLPPCNDTDFIDSRRGLVEEVRDLQIKDAGGRIVWDMKAYYDFISPEKPAPDTVNPSLWRQEQLNTIAGLFEVTDGIWQVRGFDISNLTIIRSKTGYIVVDCLMCCETSRAALELFFRHFEKKDIKAVILTHSHGDHFGGVGGVVSPEDVRSGKIPLVAPHGFMEEAISENVFVGDAMKRRGAFQFGGRLPIGPQGQVGDGLGKNAPRGTTFLVQPTEFVEHTGQTMNIDGIDFIFQMTPEAEAPAEMCIYLPQFRALCMAEIVSWHQHNLLPLRGAKARSAFMWAGYLQEALHMFGDRTDVLFICHHWPRWGREAVRYYLKKQRDMYKYINDQTVRGIRHGLTMNEIAEEMKLPPSLDSEWSCKGYYGALSHNVKATYQRYLGWYDGVPATLNPLPPEEAGAKYVEFMGGPEETLQKARASFEKGDYRWAATVLNHLVFSGLGGAEAEELLADTYEQLGYQAECATWRNCYLNGAKELRDGPVSGGSSTVTSRTLENLPTGDLIAYLAGMVDPARAENKSVCVSIAFSDTGETCSLGLENCVMNCWPEADAEATSSCRMTRKTLNRLAGGELTVEQAVADGLIEEDGEKGVLQTIFDALEKAPAFFFNIVRP